MVRLGLTQIPAGTLLLRSTYPLEGPVPPRDVLWNTKILKIPLQEGQRRVEDTFDLAPNTRYYYRLVSSCGREWLSCEVTTVTGGEIPCPLAISVVNSCTDGDGTSSINFVFRPSYPVCETQFYSLSISSATSILITVSPTMQVTLLQSGVTNPGATYFAQVRPDGTIRISIVGLIGLLFSPSGTQATFYRVAWNGTILYPPTTFLIPPPTTPVTTCTALFGGGPYIPLPVQGAL